MAREMTKMHEELVRGSVAELAAARREWLGEITLVLGSDVNANQHPVDESELTARIAEAVGRGETARTAATRIAAWSGRPRREIYARLLEAARKDSR